MTLQESNSLFSFLLKLPMLHEYLQVHKGLKNAGSRHTRFQYEILHRALHISILYIYTFLQMNI